VCIVKGPNLNNIGCMVFYNSIDRICPYHLNNISDLILKDDLWSVHDIILKVLWTLSKN